MPCSLMRSMAPLFISCRNTLTGADTSPIQSNCVRHVQIYVYMAKAMPQGDLKQLVLHQFGINITSELSILSLRHTEYLSADKWTRFTLFWQTMMGVLIGYFSARQFVPEVCDTASHLLVFTDLNGKERTRARIRKKPKLRTTQITLMAQQHQHNRVLASEPVHATCC
jgi:hypothetical protein